MEWIKNFCKDESGASAEEYALIVTLIALAIIAGATVLGQKVNTIYDNAQKAF